MIVDWVMVGLCLTASAALVGFLFTVWVLVQLGMMIS